MKPTAPLLLSILSLSVLVPEPRTQHLLRTHQLAPNVHMFSVGSAGDLDRDGFDEYLTATPSELRIHSGADGRILQRVQAPPRQFSPITEVSATADLDRDGAPELILGDGWFVDTNGRTVGQVLVYDGKTLLTSTPKLLASWQGAPLSPGAPNLGAFDVVGDLNKDGYQDIVIGAGYEGKVYIKSGIWAVKRSGPEHLLPTIQGTWGLGAAIAGLGDLTGDSIPEFAVAHTRFQLDTGRVFVYDGKTGREHWQLPPPSSGSARFFGQVMRNVGDVNGDGFADLAAGSHNSYANSGQVVVFSGRGISRKRTASFFQRVGQNSERLAGNLTGLGDINGDGFDDFAVGVAGTPSGRGRAEVFLGGKPPALRPWRVFRPTASSGGLGTDAAHLNLAGDVNGDGHPDMLSCTWRGGAVGGGFVEILSLDPVLMTSPTHTIPFTNGGAQQFDIHGASHAGATYLVLGSASGRKPGFTFQNQHVPLNPDILLTTIPHPYLTAAIGVVGAGVTRATLNLPAPLPPAAKGLVLAHACAVFRGAQLVTMSNAVPVRIE